MDAKLGRSHGSFSWYPELSASLCRSPLTLSTFALFSRSSYRLSLVAAPAASLRLHHSCRVQRPHFTFRLSTQYPLRLPHLDPFASSEMAILPPAAFLALIVASASAIALSKPNSTQAASSGRPTGYSGTPGMIGPVIETPFEQPSLLVVDGVSYSFASGIGGANVQMAKSYDFKTWQLMDKDPMPDITNARWILNSYRRHLGDSHIPLSHVDVVQHKDRFIMQFAAPSEDDGQMCLGAAFADYVEGPYTPDSTYLLCSYDPGFELTGGSFAKIGDDRLLAVYANTTYNPRHIRLNKVLPIPDISTTIQYIDIDIQDPNGTAVADWIHNGTGAADSHPRILFSADSSSQLNPPLEAPYLIPFNGTEVAVFFGMQQFGGVTYLPALTPWEIRFATGLLSERDQIQAPLGVEGQWLRTTAPSGNMTAPRGLRIDAVSGEAVFNAGFRAATNSSFHQPKKDGEAFDSSFPSLLYTGIFNYTDNGPLLTVAT